MTPQRLGLPLRPSRPVEKPKAHVEIIIELRVDARPLRRFVMPLNRAAGPPYEPGAF